ncbi:MAG: alpha/beta hydrolase [Alphaproteobacteria bacterium]|nr:alpha/beta hydrolase [Alphaproteobacteria bacterium]
MLPIALAVVAAAGMGVFLLFERDMRRARRRLAGRSQVINTTFGALEYASAGDGEPVLAIHGAGGGFDQGLEMTGVLTSHGWRLIAPSRFGYLRSSNPATTTPAVQADAYAELLHSIAVRKAVVVGISAAAWSALQFAIRHPDLCRALVLLVPAAPLPKGTAIHGGLITRIIFASDFATWLALKLVLPSSGRMRALMLGTPTDVLSAASAREKLRVRDILVHLLPIRVRSAGMQIDIYSAAEAKPYTLDKITCPVLAISAQDDAFGTAARAKEIAAIVPNGTNVIFPSGGHTLTGRQTEVLRDVLSFLSTNR